MDETPQKRTDRAQAVIDNHLANYFTEEQLAPLTNDEVDILSEYFSNQQLKELKSAPSQMLQQLVSRHVKSVERQRLTNIPLDEYDEMIAYYKEHADEIEEVVCNRCNNVIAVEIKHSEYKSDKYFNNPNLHWQGRFVIAVGNRLLGYRKRLDDVMGYRCGCYMDNPDFESAKQDYQKQVAAYQERLDNWTSEHEKHAEDLNDWEKKYGTGRDRRADDPDSPFLPVKKGAPSKPVWTGGSKPEMPLAPQIPMRIPCGNESTMAPVELEVIDDEHIAQSVVSQADVMKVKQHISETDYEKPVEKVKNGYLLDDKFLLRKVQ